LKKALSSLKQEKDKLQNDYKQAREELIELRKFSNKAFDIVEKKESTITQLNEVYQATQRALQTEQASHQTTKEAEKTIPLT